ncbi:MAG: hypothetical protein M3Y88_04685, partial [Chloroflexota bacterium]|nr:hypothetical protein [Chloroflexota bacterium]
MSRRVELWVGLMLFGIGILVLASEPIARWIGGLGISNRLLAWWPALLIALSLFFLVPALFGRQHRRLRAGMVIPGTI